MVPGGNPVTAALSPGLRPRFPLTTVGPVFVTVEAAKIAKVTVDPRVTGNCAAGRVEQSTTHTRTAPSFLKSPPFCNAMSTMAIRFYMKYLLAVK
jgi:hypothetical protein